MGIEKYKEGFNIRTHPDSLNIPFTWKKPKVVFVNSMSDLFHPDVPVEFIKAVFLVMNQTQKHTYQILTKRSDRLLELSDQLSWTPNIWMGVSVESDDYTFRIQDLTSTGAYIKFVSIEPLIGAIKFLNINKIDWVIVGGESGHKARPIKKIWIESIQKVCLETQTPFFFKQWGKPKFNVNQNDPTISPQHPQHAKGGCELNGQIFRQLPQKLSLVS